MLVVNFFLKQIQQIIGIQGSKTTIKGLTFEKINLSGFIVMNNGLQNQRVKTWAQMPLILLNKRYINNELFQILEKTSFCNKMVILNIKQTLKF